MTMLMARVLGGFAVAWALLVVCVPALAAQQGLRGQLAARGLPDELAQRVESVAVRAGGEGLPWQPLADKAIEGWAKHVPGPRIVAAVEAFAGRLGEGRAAVRAAGVGEPDGALIRAAADALGSGLAEPQIGAVMRAAPRPALRAPALTVAAALRAQGVPAEQAVSVVAESMRGGRTMTQLLDIPQAMRAMQQQGLSPIEAGRRILRGTPPDIPGPGRQGPRGNPPPAPPLQPVEPPIVIAPMS